jgi:hypothetical protein
MEVDIIGIENVAEFIKNTGLTKFCIDRIGASRGNLPIFELLNNNSNEKAVYEFKKWAKVINNANSYKLTLFDKVESYIDETGEEKTLKSKSKLNKAEIYFKLSDIVAPSRQDTNTFSVDEVRATIKRELETEQKIKELEQKINELESEDEDEDEGLSGLNGLSLPNILSAISALSNMNSNKTAPVINGVEQTEKSEKINNINKAIKTLAKFDEQIDTDLLKLSEIAENNPVMFKTLINTLRTM